MSGKKLFELDWKEAVYEPLLMLDIMLIPGSGEVNRVTALVFLTHFSPMLHLVKMTGFNLKCDSVLKWIKGGVH